MIKLLFVFVGLSACAQPAVSFLKPSKSIALDIPEPSDVCVAANGKTLFIVSDDGGLYETDLEGKVLRSTTLDLTDTEGVYADNENIYLVEESNRFIKQYAIKDFALVNTVYVPYPGGRNKSFESIAKRSEGGFVLFTEKDPVWMFELNEQLQETGRAKWNLPGDISAATFHNNALWLLSDERAEIWLTDLGQKSIVRRFKLPVLNPEGIAFLPNGTLLILSDDEHRLYFFNDFNTTSDEKK
jgi:uncharacterized protein YjiK